MPIEIECAGRGEVVWTENADEAFSFKGVPVVMDVDHSAKCVTFVMPGPDFKALTRWRPWES